LIAQTAVQQFYKSYPTAKKYDGKTNILVYVFTIDQGNIGVEKRFIVSKENNCNSEI
jgi:hypothetical protein